MALRGIKNEMWTFARKTRSVDEGRMRIKCSRITFKTFPKANNIMRGTNSMNGKSTKEIMSIRGRNREGGKERQ